MKEQEGKFTGCGGVQIFWRSWLPDTVRAVCVICHGLGEHSGRYAALANDLCEKDLACFALDHRGHGRSEGKRGHILFFNEYLSDLDDFRRLIHERFNDIPAFLIGHSMGGLIAARYVEDHGTGLSGLALSSAALRVEVNEPGVKLAMGRLLSKVLPGVAMSNGLDSNLLSHDRKVVEEYEKDPLVHDRVSARWFTEFTQAIETVQERAHQISIPVLVMQSGDDGLVAPRGAQEFYDRLSVEDKKIKVWENFYHEMFNELDREKPVSLLINWIEEHLY